MLLSRMCTVRNAIPVQVKAKLAVAGGQTSVTVEAAGADMLENDPSAHIDVDRSLILKMPSGDPGGGLSQAITYSTGGVAADGNGFFHPLGDHAQASFVIDGQPISDQQSKVFSTQLPTSAIQSMEVTTGTPDAEFGDKSSLVAQITTRSGLGRAEAVRQRRSELWIVRDRRGQCRAWASAARSSGISSRSTACAAGGFWTRRSSRRFTTTATTKPFSTAWIISPTARMLFHLNLFAARNWIQIPNVLRPAGAGSASARADLEHRAGLSAHLQCAHAC